VRKLTRLQAVDMLIKDMETWDRDNLLGYAQQLRKKTLIQAPASLKSLWFDLEAAGLLDSLDEYGEIRLVEDSNPDSCVRCGCDLGYTEEGMRCSDQACPFLEYEQDDPMGWIGHPDPPSGIREKLECLEREWKIGQTKTEETK